MQARRQNRVDRQTPRPGRSHLVGGENRAERVSENIQEVHRKSFVE